jgi:hypothetical protein
MNFFQQSYKNTKKSVDNTVLWYRVLRYTLTFDHLHGNAKKYSPFGRAAHAHLLRYQGLAVLGVRLHP